MVRGILTPFFKFAALLRGRLFNWRDDDVVPTLLFIVYAGVALCMPPHNDTWWLLRSGQEMWHTKTLLLTEQFSHTAYGATLNNHEWLTQLIFFGLFSGGGPFLLTLFCATCVLAAVCGAWRLMSGPADVRLFLLLVVMLGTTPEWAIRPQVISLAMLVLTTHLAVRNRVAWLPIVCFVWANLHGMVLFGIVVAGCVAVESLWWSRGRALRDAVAAGSCLAVPLFTPIGLSYWSQVRETVTTSRVLGIHEYRPAFELGQIPYWCVVTALVFLAIRAFRHRAPTRSERILLLISGVLAVAGAMSVRNIPFFLLIALPTASQLLPRSVDMSERPASKGALRFAMFTVLISAAIVAYRWRGDGGALGWRPIDRTAVEAIRACKDPIFNGFADGGPIMWFVPERRVFVDSRVEAYPFHVLQQSRSADVDGDYRATFDDYEIECAVVATDSTLATQLAQDPALIRQFSDDQWTVFAVRSRVPERESSIRAVSD